MSMEIIQYKKQELLKIGNNLYSEEDIIRMEKLEQRVLQEYSTIKQGAETSFNTTSNTEEVTA